MIRWVHAEVKKVEFLLKDMKKKEQILTKLAMLPKDWTTYRPWQQALAAISSTSNSLASAIKSIIESQWIESVLATCSIRMKIVCKRDFPYERAKKFCRAQKRKWKS